MKRKYIKALACVGLLSLTSCGINAIDESNITVLSSVNYEANSKRPDIDYNMYLSYVKTLNSFSSDFLVNSLEEFDKIEENFCVSPLSMYMALAMAAESASGTTRSEILSALNVDYNDLVTYTKSMYELSNTSNKSYNELLTNSVWIDKSAKVNNNCIESLKNNYYTNSYHVDFSNDNENVNKKISSFVKEKTNNLINQDFKLSKKTLFAIVNTLYLKTMWNDLGNDLSYYQDSISFTNNDNSKKNIQMLSGYYTRGRAYSLEKYKTFYTTSKGGYQLKFIVPNDGYTLDDVCTSDILTKVANKTDYLQEDENYEYNTRCIFPEYKAACNIEATDVLKKSGIVSLFDPNTCDYSNITSDDCYCSKVIHITKLDVSKKGIEGAAVTVMENEATSIGPNEKIKVYEDFIVDRAFAFIISDRYGVELFSGVVNKL